MGCRRRMRARLARVEPPPIPEPTVTRFPTEPRSHTIVRDTPMEAWSEMIFRLFRFGHRNMVAKKSGPEGRVELQNIKAIVENPQEEPDEILQQYGFSLEKFQGYQQRILDPEKPSDLGYTYGNRLRGYFRRDGKLVDSLEIAGQRLKEKPESRHAYIALWDNTRDLPEGTDTPCFVSAFFRKFDGKLTLTATFRSHNAMEAWPENVYGLIAIQRFVAEKAGMEPGPLTVFSHSISIDVSSLEKARKIATSKESDEVYDPATGKHRPAHGSERSVYDDVRSRHLGARGRAFLRRNEDRRISRQERGRNRAATGARCGAVGDLARAVSGPRNRAQGIRDEGRSCTKQRKSE